MGIHTPHQVALHCGDLLWMDNTALQDYFRGDLKELRILSIGLEHQRKDIKSCPLLWWWWDPANVIHDHLNGCVVKYRL